MAWGIRDKVVLITGATDGIGKAAATELARLGAHLVIVARDKDKGERMRRELAGQSDHTHVDVLHCDLASLSSIRACAQEFSRRFNRLDVLLNAAGVMPTRRELSQDGIELNMAVNYFAPVLLTELLLPLMRQSAPARVINVTSSMHAEGAIDLAHLKDGGPFDRYDSYSASKLALMLYTHYRAPELRREHITLNAVHPGWIKTKLALGVLGEDALSRVLNPLRMRSPRYGARSLVYMAADPAAGEFSGAYITKEERATPSPKAIDSALAEALFAETKKILAPYMSAVT